MQPVFQQNSQRRSVRHAELLAVRARVSSQRPFLTGGGFLVLVISCGRDAAKLFPQFPGTGCFLPLAVSYRRPFPVAGRFLRLAHHPARQAVVKILFAADSALVLSHHECRRIERRQHGCSALNSSLAGPGGIRGETRCFNELCAPSCRG